MIINPSNYLVKPNKTANKIHFPLFLQQNVIHNVILIALNITSGGSAVFPLFAPPFHHRKCPSHTLTYQSTTFPHCRRWQMAATIRTTRLVFRRDTTLGTFTPLQCRESARQPTIRKRMRKLHRTRYPMFSMRPTMLMLFGCNPTKQPPSSRLPIRM